MKNLLLLTVICLVGTANAKVINITLPKLEVEQSEEGVQSRANVAVASIDTEEKTISLKTFDDPCGQMVPREPGTVSCMAMSVLVDEIVVPLLNVTTSCGSIVYSGRSGSVMADGIDRQVQVTDHTTRICEDMVPARYVAKASVAGGWLFRTTIYRALGNIPVVVLESPATSDQQTYDALNIKAVNKAPDMVGSQVLEKSLGGLVCTKSTVVVPNARPSYNCEKLQSLDGEKLYNALNVEEVAVNPGFVGLYNIEKKAGNLSCYKFQHQFDDKIVFSCQLER